MPSESSDAIQQSYKLCWGGGGVLLGYCISTPPARPPLTHYAVLDLRRLSSQGGLTLRL